VGAIPTSDLPGHKQLHDRVINALGTCQESRDIDFKQSASWKDIKFKISKTALAMSNLRDGGIIIVGVAESASSWSLTGVSEADLKTYSVDDIIAFINRYASPNIIIDCVTVEHDSKKYLAIRIPEFEDVPVVCKQNGPDGSGIVRGGIYVRPIGKAETTLVQEASQLHDLLDIAAERKARKFLEAAERIGLLASRGGEDRPDESEKFDQELKGLKP
jgi:predicted HTH transcriptional regulator